MELEKIRLNTVEVEISIYCRSNLREPIKYNENLRLQKPKIYNICQIFVNDLPKKKAVHDRFTIIDGEI